MHKFDESASLFDKSQTKTVLHHDDEYLAFPYGKSLENTGIGYESSSCTA